MNNLKVDRSFVNQMQGGGKKNHRIVRNDRDQSTVELVSIAEGIETSQQLEWLQQLGYRNLVKDILKAS
jgi:EAL domain-containing protein (putative c-di-GMP-specific phosphodiesterase class I)